MLKKINSVNILNFIRFFLGIWALQRNNLQLRQLPLVPRMEINQNNELNYFLLLLKLLNCLD